MNALENRVLDDICRDRVYLDGNGNVRVTDDTVVEAHDQTAYIHTVRDLVRRELAMDEWRAAPGTIRKLYLTDIGAAAWRAGDFQSPAALTCVGGVYEAVTVQ